MKRLHQDEIKTTLGYSSFYRQYIFDVMMQLWKKNIFYRKVELNLE